MSSLRKEGWDLMSNIITIECPNCSALQDVSGMSVYEIIVCWCCWHTLELIEPDELMDLDGDE